MFENRETLSCMDTISNELLRGSVGEAGICACEVKFQIQGGHAKGRVSHFELKLWLSIISHFLSNSDP